MMIILLLFLQKQSLASLPRYLFGYRLKLYTCFCSRLLPWTSSRRKQLRRAPKSWLSPTKARKSIGCLQRGLLRQCVAGFQASKNKKELILTVCAHW